MTAGRRPLDGQERMGTGTVRLSSAEASKFAALGGSAWLRQQIDGTPLLRVHWEDGRCGEVRKTRGFTRTAAQAAKLEVLGGAPWIRYRINSATLPA